MGADRKWRILLVDDEAALTASYATLLESRGYRVTTCENGTDALNAFKATPDHYDLVLTDLVMPNLSGEELASEILSLRPETPIILMTGYGTSLTQAEASDKGIKGYLEKPVNLHQLQKSIQDCLQH